MSVAAASATVAARVDARGGRRLDAVDGLRAIAALWVVMFHIRAFSGATLGPLDIVIRSGSTGVSLFLVLSGFCLYLPVARGTPFTAWRFFVRRARRLLPAYYASLGVVILATVLAAGRLGFVHYGPVALGGQIAAHLTMTHSLFPSTFYALNGAYWSLALEWQLYLGLPLLVFGVRRFGLARTVAAVVAANVAYRLGLQVAIATHAGAATSLWATAVLPNLLPGRWAEFAFGMVAAQLYADGRIGRNWARAGWIAIPLVVLSLLAVGTPLAHLLFGSVFFVLLCAVLAPGSVVSRVVAWRPLSALGVMSYSLYLVHQPLVQALATLARQNGASPLTAFGITLFLLPIVIAAAWLLFVTVERRTLRTAGVPERESPEWLLLGPLRWFAAVSRTLRQREVAANQRAQRAGSDIATSTAIRTSEESVVEV